MFKFAKWLGSLDVVQAALVGIYASMIPAVYCAIHLFNGTAGGLVQMYALFCMFGLPVFVCINFHLITKYTKDGEQ